MPDDPECSDCYREILHVRQHSLFAPRDFDVSPTAIVKPRIAVNFDHRSLAWTNAQSHSPVAPSVPVAVLGNAIVPPPDRGYDREHTA